MAESILPSFRYNVPKLNHVKTRPYIDFPIAFNATVTEEPFYVSHEFTFVTSDSANTTLYKWNGSGWTEITGWANPEHFTGHGYFSITTAANASVAITEHVQ